MNIKAIIQNKEKTIEWLNEIKQGSGDARPLWKAMVPKIQEFLDYQFREEGDSGKRWRSLKPVYKKWKKKNGFPSGIGVMTGLLKAEAGANAQKTFRKDSLIWKLNQNKVKQHGKKYAHWFNKDRPVYRNVALRINSFLSFDVKEFENGSHNSFTYLWLKGAIEKTK